MTWTFSAGWRELEQSRVRLNVNTLTSIYRLAVFESRRENDCVTKYLIEEYEDTVAQDYAIGMKVDETYMGVYEWNGVEPTTENPGLASLTFTNWIPSKTFKPTIFFSRDCSMCSM